MRRLISEEESATDMHMQIGQLTNIHPKEAASIHGKVNCAHWMSIKQELQDTNYSEICY